MLGASVRLNSLGATGMLLAARSARSTPREGAMAARDPAASAESVARVTEITARSSKSFEDAIRVGVQRATKTLRHVRGAWIKEQHVEIKDGEIVGYQVNMLITFLLEDAE
jgi:dodecin